MPSDQERFSRRRVRIDSFRLFLGASVKRDSETLTGRTLERFVPFIAWHFELLLQGEDSSSKNRQLSGVLDSSVRTEFGIWGDRKEFGRPKEERPKDSEDFQNVRFRK